MLRVFKQKAELPFCVTWFFCLEDLGGWGEKNDYYFTGNRFFTLDNEKASGLGKPYENRFIAEFGGEKEARKGYHKLEVELHKLADIVLQSYKSYRIAVREILHI